MLRIELDPSFHSSRSATTVPGTLTCADHEDVVLRNAQDDCPLCVKRERAEDAAMFDRWRRRLR